MPGTIELELLHTAARKFQTQSGQSRNEVSDEHTPTLTATQRLTEMMSQTTGCMEGFAQWKNSGNPWQLMAVLLRDGAIHLNNTADEPGAEGNHQVQRSYPHLRCAPSSGF